MGTQTELIKGFSVASTTSCQRQSVRLLVAGCCRAPDSNALILYLRGGCYELGGHQRTTCPWSDGVKWWFCRYWLKFGAAVSRWWCWRTEGCEKESVGSLRLIYSTQQSRGLSTSRLNGIEKPFASHIRLYASLSACRGGGKFGGTEHSWHNTEWNWWRYWRALGCPWFRQIYCSSVWRSHRLECRWAGPGCLVEIPWSETAPERLQACGWYGPDLVRRRLCFSTRRWQPWRQCWCWCWFHLRARWRST